MACVVGTCVLQLSASILLFLDCPSGMGKRETRLNGNPKRTLWLSNGRRSPFNFPPMVGRWEEEDGQEKFPLRRSKVALAEDEDDERKKERTNIKNKSKQTNFFSLFQTCRPKRGKANLRETWKRDNMWWSGQVKGPKWKAHH